MKRREEEEEEEEDIQDLARFGGSDLGFGGVHNAINDSARDSAVENLAKMHHRTRKHTPVSPPGREILLPTPDKHLSFLLLVGKIYRA